MSGAFAWWANRKSRIGLSPAALPPPHLPGKEWWTTPPTAPPQPEHIEYVVNFLRQVQGRPQNHKRDALLGRISDWLRAARQLLHEQVQSQRGDLHTTDGLICEAEHAVIKLIGKCITAGVLDFDSDEYKRFEEVRQALQARSATIKRERVISAARTPAPARLSRAEMPRMRVGARLRGSK